MTGTTVFWMSLWLFLGWTLTGPKKASKSRILYDRLNKEKLLVDVANLATCWTNGYDILLEVLGTLGRIYVSRPVAKTLVLDWKSWLAQLFLDVFVTLCGVNPYWTQKKLQNQQFYIIDWIRKKLLVDVTNLATCWTNDYDILLEVLGTLGRIYVSRPVAKLLITGWPTRWTLHFS